jgi:hypothetical protein
MKEIYGDIIDMVEDGRGTMSIVLIISKQYEIAFGEAHNLVHQVMREFELAEDEFEV